MIKIMIVLPTENHNYKNNDDKDDENDNNDNEHKNDYEKEI